MRGRSGWMTGVGGKLAFVVVLGVIGWQVAGRRATPAAVAQAAPVSPKPVSPPRAATMPTASPPPVARADDGFVVKRILDLKAPLRHGDYAWDEVGVPDGPIVITIDLAAEMLSIFRDGYEIGAAPILYGADSKPTPLGTFPILQKDARHVSGIYGAPMPWALRLTDDGVFVHASEVAWDRATHGCIGVPKAFAEKLFGQAQVGDPVIITRGKAMRVPEPMPHS